MLSNGENGILLVTLIRSAVPLAGAPGLTHATARGRTSFHASQGIGCRLCDNYVRFVMPRPRRAEVLSDYVRLTSVCLSVAYIGPKSRTERPRKTEIGTEVAHVTRDSDTTFKVKRSKLNLQGAGHIVAACRTACSGLRWPSMVFCW